MSSDVEVDLMEFERLREEIDSRTQLANQLVSYEIVALGAGIAVLDKYPDVLLGLAAISTFLWLFWIDHTVQVYKIAAYVDLRLADRLRERGADLLGWERFLRDIDFGGERREQALYGNAIGRNIEIQSTAWISTYTAALLGCSTLILLAIYMLPKLYQVYQIGLHALSAHINTFHIVRGLTVVAIFIIWGFAWFQNKAFLKTRESVADAIAERALRVQATPMRSSKEATQPTTGTA